MHLFLGFTIAEWGGIIAIGSALIGAIYKVAVKPLRDELSNLSRSINSLHESSKTDHKRFDDRLDRHDIRLERHDAELQFLYDKNNLTRRKPGDRE